jgi:hypothetical protein
MQVIERVVTIPPGLRHVGYHWDALIEWDMRQNLLFLCQELGFERHELENCIKKHPIVLIHNVATMRENVKFYRRILCLDAPRVRKLILVQPGVLGTSARYPSPCLPDQQGACQPPKKLKSLSSDAPPTTPKSPHTYPADLALSGTNSPLHFGARTVLFPSLHRGRAHIHSHARFPRPLTSSPGVPNAAPPLPPDTSFSHFSPSSCATLKSRSVTSRTSSVSSPR